MSSDDPVPTAEELQARVTNGVEGASKLIVALIEASSDRAVRTGVGLALASGAGTVAGLACHDDALVKKFIEVMSQAALHAQLGQTQMDVTAGFNVGPGEA